MGTYAELEIFVLDTKIDLTDACSHSYVTEKTHLRGKSQNVHCSTSGAQLRGQILY